MKEKQASPENIYSLSTASILDQATLKAALLWSIQDHVDMAHNSGYRGVELWPQGIKPLRQIRSGTISETEKQGILSAHQSARATRVRSPREVQKAVFLPETITSLTDLNRIHQVVGNIPVILFKETPQEYLHSGPHTQRWFQTDPETSTAWGIKNAKQYSDVAKDKGFTHLVIDTHHLRRPDIKTGKQNPLANWQESIPVLLPDTKELHIGIGRTDYGNMNPQQIKEEAVDLLSGGEKNTEIIQMLKLIANKGWQGVVVIEMRPSIYKEILGRKFFLSGNDLVDINERVRNTLYHIFDN